MNASRPIHPPIIPLCNLFVPFDKEIPKHWKKSTKNNLFRESFSGDVVLFILLMKFCFQEIALILSLPIETSLAKFPNCKKRKKE